MGSQSVLFVPSVCIDPLNPLCVGVKCKGVSDNPFQSILFNLFRDAIITYKNMIYLWQTSTLTLIRPRLQMQWVLKKMKR